MTKKALQILEELKIQEIDILSEMENEGTITSKLKKRLEDLKKEVAQTKKERNLGDVIRIFREAKGVAAYTLAWKSGIDIVAVERGDKGLSATEVDRLVEGLGLGLFDKAIIMDYINKGGV